MINSLCMKVYDSLSAFTSMPVPTCINDNNSTNGFFSSSRDCAATVLPQDGTSSSTSFVLYHQPEEMVMQE